MGDLSPRAIETLEDADLICCEDTRRTGKLLQLAGIAGAKMLVTNEHTEYHKTDHVMDVLAAGQQVAVVSDAGTPGISDPGEHLVRAAIEHCFDVVAVPGPVAVTTALTISGLPTARFVFEGFLPRSGRDRTRLLTQLATEERTMVFYEAPHRIIKTLTDMSTTFGADRPVAVCRELTKRFEDVIRGTLGTVDIGDPRGEYVLVVGGVPLADIDVDDDTLRRALADLLASGATKKSAVASVVETYHVPKKRVYALSLEL